MKLVRIGKKEKTLAVEEHIVKSAQENEELEYEVVSDKFVTLMSGIYFDSAIDKQYILTVYTALCLARYGKTNVAKISMKTLCTVARTTETSARKAIKLLVERGYILEVKSGRNAGQMHKSNTYVMHDKPVPFKPLEGTAIAQKANDFIELNSEALREISNETGKPVQLELNKSEKDFKVKESSSAPQPLKTEDTPAIKEVETPVEVENAPVESDKPARKKVKLLAVKKTSNVENAPIKSARRKFKVKNAPAIKEVETPVKTSNEVQEVKTSNDAPKTSNTVKRLNYNEVKPQVMQNFRALQNGRQVPFPEFEEEARKYKAEGYI